jgi:hypothetical protein
MPQFDSFIFFNEIFWFFIGFIFLYIFFLKYGNVSISFLLKLKNKQKKILKNVPNSFLMISFFYIFNFFKPILIKLVLFFNFISSTFCFISFSFI